MSQNLVIPNKDNKVVYVFSGVDLTLSTDIQVEFGSESYSLINDPLIVIVTSATELSLNLSATLEVGKVFSTVTYFDGASVNGTDITSRELGNSSQIIVAIGTQLIVEDGTQVTNANSLVSDEEYKAYAKLKGLTIASTQPDREADLLAGMDYLLTQECNMQGCRVSSTQALLFPRTDMYLYGWAVNSDTVPREAKYAQMEAAAYNTSGTLLSNSESTNIQSEKIDVLEVTYFKGGSRSNVILKRVNAQLLPLMKDSNKLVRT